MTDWVRSKADGRRRSVSNGTAEEAVCGDKREAGCSSQLLESSAPEPSATTAPGEYLYITTTRDQKKTRLVLYYSVSLFLFFFVIVVFL